MSRVHLLQGSSARAGQGRCRAEEEGAHAAKRYRVVTTVNDAIMPMGRSFAGFLTCTHKLAARRWTAMIDENRRAVRY